MAKKKRVRRGVFAMEYIRTVVLDLSQAEMASLLGCAVRTIYTYENQDDIDVDMIPLHYIRLAHDYAVENNIDWPATIESDLLAGDLTITETTKS